MNTINTLYRDLTCAAASAVITLVFSMGLVVATSVPASAHTPGAVTAGLTLDHAWFGQPEPAVLVD
jgi:hypothetical protein